MASREKKIIQARAGEPFLIALWEDRTHGHSWQPRLDSTPIQLLDDRYVRTIHVDTADSGKRTFEFVCSEPGRYELIFEKRLGWKFTADDRKIFVIDVATS
jgi:predicted secreted protein